MENTNEVSNENANVEKKVTSFDRRKDAIGNIKCYHKHLSEDYLQGLTDEHLLAYVHPMDREKIAREMKG